MLNRVYWCWRAVGEGVADVIGLLVDPKADRCKADPRHAITQTTLVSSRFQQCCSQLQLMCWNTKNFWHAWEEAMTRSIVALAAQAIGAAEAIHAMATDYSKQRVQFGKPIGSFQAIAHYLADMIVKIEGAKVLVYQAAWAIDNNKPYAKLSRASQVASVQCFRDASAIGVQIHGGFGFTSEGDPQLYFRRAKHWQMTTGIRHVS
jgi:hypothetical protein